MERDRKPKPVQGHIPVLALRDLVGEESLAESHRRRGLELAGAAVVAITGLVVVSLNGPTGLDFVSHRAPCLSP